MKVTFLPAHAIRFHIQEAFLRGDSIEVILPLLKSRDTHIRNLIHVELKNKTSLKALELGITHRQHLAFFLTFCPPSRCSKQSSLLWAMKGMIQHCKYVSHFFILFYSLWWENKTVTLTCMNRKLSFWPVQTIVCQIVGIQISRKNEKRQIHMKSWLHWRGWEFCHWLEWSQVFIAKALFSCKSCHC